MSHVSMVLGDFKRPSEQKLGKNQTNHSLEKKPGAVSHTSKGGTALASKKGVGQATGNH